MLVRVRTVFTELGKTEVPFPCLQGFGPKFLKVLEFGDPSEQVICGEGVQGDEGTTPSPCPEAK